MYEIQVANAELKYKYGNMIEIVYHSFIKLGTVRHMIIPF